MEEGRLNRHHKGEAVCVEEQRNLIGCHLFKTSIRGSAIRAFVLAFAIILSRFSLLVGFFSVSLILCVFLSLTVAAHARINSLIASGMVRQTSTSVRIRRTP